VIYETRLIEHDDLRYTVQVRQCLDGSVQQRHVWQRTQAGEHDPPWVGDWIPACSRRLDLIIRNMMPAPHILDEVGQLVAALRSIADGHNNPRERAREALAAAGVAA
jgi:hypothetical protein